MTPEVSINLCCYNGETYLKETLDSILTQTFTDWELVVIDDGSQDATGFIVQQFAAHEPRIHYHFQENTGLGRARNIALEKSQGSIIALMDQDDLWDPTMLEKLVSLLRAQPDLGLVYSDLYRIDSVGRIWDRFSDDFIFHRGRVFEEMLCENFMPPPCAVLFRKSAFETVGGFDPEQLYNEDTDFYFRITSQFPVDFSPEPLCRYRVHDSNWTRQKRQQVHLEALNLLDKWVDKYPQIKLQYSKRIGSRRFALLANLALIQAAEGDFRGAWNYGLKGLKSLSYNPLTFLTLCYRQLYRRRIRRWINWRLARAGWHDNRATAGSS